MRKIQVILLDDIDGSEAARTVQFAFDGKSYEIDLSDQNIAEFEKALAPYIEKATKTPAAREGGRKRRAGSGGPSRSAQIREWAKSQGIPVPERGRIPNDVIRQYEDAH